MSKKFIWDKSTSQLYDRSYGTSVLDIEDFGKAVGTRFTLDASDEVLAIVQISKETSSEVVWGGLVEEQVSANTEINIVNGQLRIVGTRNSYKEGEGTCFYWGGVAQNHPCTASGSLRVILSNDSIFALSNLSELCTQASDLQGTGVGAADVKLLLHDNTLFVVRSVGAFIFCGELNVLDSACMDIVAGFISMDAGRFTIASELRPLRKEHSLSLRSTRDDGEVGVQLEGFLFAGKSSSLLSAGCISLADIIVRHQAVLVIEADELDFYFYPDRAHLISLGAGASAVSIMPYSLGNSATFDFMDEFKEYPEGLFNFVNDSGENTGILRLSCVPHPGQINALVSRKLLCINGVPINQPSQMNITQSADLKVLEITNL